MKCGMGPKKMKAGGKVRKYAGGGEVEIEIKVGGKGKHMMPNGTMMEEDDMESEDYKKGGRVKKMKKGGKVPKAIKMMKGGKVPCSACSNPTACKKAGRCLMGG